MDPRIRIHPKMSWIRNTGGGEEERLAIGLDDVKEAARRSHVLYDRTGDQHYFMASALQKSIRGQGLFLKDEIYCTVRVPGPPLPLNPVLNFKWSRVRFRLCFRTSSISGTNL
jgi:hypothetical protein